MTESSFDRVVVPVTDRDDAAATVATLRPCLAADPTAIAVHLIEEAGGAPDRAFVERLGSHAGEIFSVVVEGFDDTDVVPEADLHYGSDIASAIAGTVRDRCASAIRLTPRGGSRWRKLLTVDVTYTLVRSSSVPIAAPPDREETELSSPEPDQTDN